MNKIWLLTKDLQEIWFQDMWQNESQQHCNASEVDNEKLEIHFGL